MIAELDTETGRERLVAAVLTAGRQLGAAAVFFHANAAARLGLGPTDTKTLDLLQRHGSLAPSQLASLAGVTRPTMSALVDRLEARGLVHRQPHPSDGRRLLIEIASDAHEKMAPLYEGLAASFTDMLDGYTDDELRLLASAFTEIANRQTQAAHDLTPTA